MKAVPVFVSKFHTGLVAGSNENEKWDMVALVRYPNFSAFRKVVESEMYIKDAQPHRIASLEDWKLYATTEIE